MLQRDLPVDSWTARFEDWLRFQGLLQEKRRVPQRVAANDLEVCRAMIRVGAFDAAQSLLQRLPDVGRHGPHVAPMATVWHLEG